MVKIGWHQGMVGDLMLGQRSSCLIHRRRPWCYWQAAFSAWVRWSTARNVLTSHSSDTFTLTITEPYLLCTPHRPQINSRGMLLAPGCGSLFTPAGTCLGPSDRRGPRSQPDMNGKAAAKSNMVHKSFVLIVWRIYSVLNSSNISGFARTISAMQN